MARIEKEVTQNQAGNPVCKHTIETSCAHCGYDVPENANMAKCPECKEPLVVRQDATVALTTLPPLFGDASL